MHVSTENLDSSVHNIHNVLLKWEETLLKRDLEPDKFDLLALQSHVECIVLLVF